MKTKTPRRFIKGFSLLALFVFSVSLSVVAAGAQTKRIKRSMCQPADAEFFTETAERQIEEIGKLLARIERIAAEANESARFMTFKSEVEKTLTEIADDNGTEKRIKTAFLARLLQINLPAGK